MAGYSKFIKITHLTGDLLVLNFTFLLSNLIYFNKPLPKDQWVFFNIINLSWLLILLMMRPYQISRLVQIMKVLKLQFNLVLLHLVITITISYFIDLLMHQDKNYMIVFYSLFLVFNLSGKVGFVLFIRKYRRLGYNYRKLAIVGYGKLSRELSAFLKEHTEYGYKVIGFFDDEVKNSEILGTFNEIEELCIKHEIDEIYCCMPIVESKLANRLVDFGEENLITIKLITDFHEFSFKRMELQKYGGFPVINISSSPLDDFWNRLSKRIFDIILSIFVIILILSWLIPIVALLIKLDSRGRVFFIQKRTGIGNKTFNCYKFRSMAVKKDESGNEKLIMTKLGGFLRKYGIDELPQFINVLFGSMSVIGPRPHQLSHTEEYRRITEKFMFRHSIKPGITGLAQVRGYKGEIQAIHSIRNRVILDRFYIENWSMPFDIKIVLLTISDIFFSSAEKDRTIIEK